MERADRVLWGQTSGCQATRCYLPLTPAHPSRFMTGQATPCLHLLLLTVHLSSGLIVLACPSLAHSGVGELVQSWTP